MIVMSIVKLEKREKGVTLIALSITIVVMIILAGIGIYGSTDIIKKAKLEELKTNMLLLQAKAREYVEDATFKMGMNPDEPKKSSVRNEVYIENAKLQKATDSEIPSSFGITDTTTCYWLTSEAQTSWGLSKMKLESGEKYLIQFNEADVTVEVYNTKGYNSNYSLTAIDQIEE